jgi:hypothetical protein
MMRGRRGDRVHRFRRSLYCDPRAILARQAIATARGKSSNTLAPLVVGSRMRRRCRSSKARFRLSTACSTGQVPAR